MDREVFFRAWNQHFGDTPIFLRGMWVTCQDAWAMYQVGLLTNHEARQIYFGDVSNQAVIAA